MTGGRRALAFAVAISTVATTVGCAPDETVVRVIDGRPVPGELVPADAYAAYLRASIADAAGDVGAAIEGYAIASTLGPRDPEPLARLGDALCRREAHDPRADEAIARALRIDGAYAPALQARAACAERRGDARAARESAERAASADPRAVAPLATLARLEPEGRGPAAEELRARLEALTLVAGTDAAAWRALATWARGHGDAILEGRALAKVTALVASSEQGTVDDAIRRFVGRGEMAAARSLARARVEAGATGPFDPRIVRLAIDDALSAGDAAAARRIATHGRVPLVVVAARELLRGDDDGARRIAETLSAAEPEALAPRLVLAAAGEGLRDGATVTKALGTPISAVARGRDAAVPPDVWLPYARAVARRGSPEGARAVVAAIMRDPIVGGDPLATSLAVDLAAAGVVDPAQLDADGAIELAERRAEPVPDAVAAAADPRHRLLALTRIAPRDPKTIALARELAPARAHDAIVAVAFARLALAGAVDVTATADTLSRFDPADPLVAGAALDCALRAGDARAIPLARARLAAVAHTAAERARILE